MSRLLSLCALLACACTLTLAAQTSSNPFLGKWDITATNAKGVSYPYWLEVSEENGQLTAWFQDRGGSVHKVAEIAREGNDLVFSMGAPKAGAPKPVHRAHVESGKLVGELTTGANKVSWVGVRPPTWGKYNANGPHRFGEPVVLFNGKDLTGFRFQYADQPPGWAVTDGILTNADKPGNNIISERQFKDFRVVMEYKLEKESNSGLYLRGRYELQVLDDFGKAPNLTSHIAVYGRVAPVVNASKPAGEWQTVEATIVGNRVTVVLNGQKVHENVAIEGITGGALDSNEGAPGPIMIQGDHSKIWVRKLVVTPVI